MIKTISIRNYAIIENTQIDFEKGLNIITGETGAGKSIVIEAISLALGSRADSSAIRAGCDKAVVQLLGELNGEEFVITREVSSSGKNLCKLNGEIVTLSQLNSLCSRLADIHGQYDNQSLLNPEYHITLLDAYKSDLISPVCEAVARDFDEYSKIKNELSSLLRQERENARQKDFYQYELAEIDNAALSCGEDEKLQEKISVLQNSEKIFEGIEKSYSALSEQTPCVLDGLSSAISALDSIAGFSSELGRISEEASDMYYRLKDISAELRDMRDELTFSPAELDALISRLDAIDNLKKKYGDTIEDILNYRDSVSEKLSVIENFDDIKHNLEKKLRLSRQKLMEDCGRLTEIRQAASAELSEKIQKELLDLNFADAVVSISLEPLDTPTSKGMDKVEILISTNKGQPMKPLYKIASGGEMSRIMLAFKNIISSYDMIPTLIFDEIDTGISGLTASIVGKKLKEISKERQIICITHLPQIACCGDFNYRIAKSNYDGGTFTTVEKLTDDEKVSEIARLLGGTEITETTLDNARELIESAAKQA